MKQFVREFQTQIEKVNTQIEKVSMQIDRLAEVSLGRDCEKLAMAIQKYNAQTAEDYDWRERLRCYIPE